MSEQSAADGWRTFHVRFAKLGLPQVPDESVAARFAEQIAGRDTRVLVLGITRVLLELGQDTTVVDSSGTQLDQFWPGDRPGRRALLGDWRNPGDLPGPFTAVVGDGSLSALVWPHDYTAALANVAAAMAPGARLVIRCFAAPDERESMEEIVEAVDSGREGSFHATRWRIAMAAADADGNVPVRNIAALFREAFPDWPALAERAGWDLSAIERILGSFSNSALTFSFVTRRQILDTLPPELGGARFVPSGDYPLSERCPFLVAERAG